MPSYITATGRFLPGPPIPNDEIEDYIGTVGANSSIVRDQTLANNGIKTRHYAIDKQQRTVISNTDMAVAAVRDALRRSEIGVDDIDLIAAASAMPDLLAPGFASLVHAKLQSPPCEIVTAGGICNAGMTALKNAHLQVASGEKRNAVVVASELASRAFKSQRYRDVLPVDGTESMALDMAFLRYMLSDGAGAVVVRDRPAAQGVSLRIDWLSLRSFANTGDTCMYFGSESGDSENTWLDYPDDAHAARNGALVLRQNLALLPNLVKHGIDEYERLLGEGRFDPDEVRWFPAHYSSEKLKEMVVKQIERRKVRGPAMEKWYSNLPQVGNIGSAAIFVILDELVTSGLVSAGDKILCMVPESGRFSVAFMHLTAVTADGAGV